MIRARPALVALAYACALNCDPAPDGDPGVDASPVHLREQLSAATHTRPLCGEQPSRGVRHYFLLDAEQCLGCEEVGFALRRIGRDTAFRERTAVLTSEEDGPEVCGYLAREKVRVPVFRFSHPLAPASRERFVHYQVRADSAPVEETSARSMSLLAGRLLAAPVQPSSPPLQPARPK